jgi:signal transduction histidine kinase
MVRNLGLGILTALILMISSFAFFILTKIDNKIKMVMEKERPSLNVVLQAQDHFGEIHPHFYKYITGQLDNYQLILRHIENIQQDLKGIRSHLPVEERKHLQKFNMSLKYLKYSIKEYNEEIQYDPASSNTAELAEIVSQKMSEANASLNMLVANIRHRINSVDKEILAEIEKNKQILFIFLLLAVTVGLTMTLVINRALAAPVNQLIEGANKIGNGNLDWRIKQEHEDEFGQLAASFNTMAEKLKDTQNQLLQAEKLAAIGQLAAGVSHELNNPLGGILGYSQFILETANKKGIQNLTPQDFQTYLTYIGYIERESQRCKTIVQNLLSFSRTSEAEFVPLDVNQALEETLALTQHQLYMNQIELIKQLQPNLAQVIGNKHRLQQVFTNMIINAQQAMPEGGKLTVSTAVNDGMVEISFADTGCGISQEHLDKLFDPFFTTKEAGKGTGLGLSVSYGIIKDHSGKIQVESKPDHGATFIIRLPTASDRQAAEGETVSGRTGADHGPDPEE